MNEASDYYSYSSARADLEQYRRMTQLPGNRAIFLDRDGVLVRPLGHGKTTRPPWKPEEVQFMPRAWMACWKLHQAGWLLVCVTNQPDVRRGNMREVDANSIDDLVRRHFPLTDYRVCRHDEADRCCCRKPSPGLLRQAAAMLSIDLEHSVMVGDRLNDMLAGEAAGCRTVFIGEPKGIENIDHAAPSLWEALPWILAS